MSARRRRRRAAAAAVAWIALAAATAPQAQAHALLVASAPRDGARLVTAPATVSLRFSEPVQAGPNAVRVVDQTGRSVVAGGARTDARDASVVVVALRADAGAASYLVSYAVSAEDSHPVSGTVRFVVGDGPLPTASGAVADASATDAAVSAAYDTLRWIAFAGLVLVGGILVVSTTWPEAAADRRVARLVLGGCAVSAAAAAGTLLLYGPYSGVPGSWTAAVAGTLDTPYGRLLVLRLAALATLAAVARRLLTARETTTEVARARDENIAIGAALVILLSFSGAGHAVDDRLPVVTLMADLTHVGAMALWLGGVFVLAVCAGGSGAPPGADAALRRFSVLAAWLVGTIAVTGMWLASRTLGTPAALWSTPYGRILVIKSAIVVALLAVAAGVRRRVHGDGLWASPGRALAAELCVAGVVLGVTSVLVSTPQPSDDTSTRAGKRAVVLNIAPRRFTCGPTVHLTLFPRAVPGGCLGYTAAEHQSEVRALRAGAARRGG